MAFTKDEKELLLDVLDRAIYESQDEVEGIETYLNYLRREAVPAAMHNSAEGFHNSYTRPVLIYRFSFSTPVTRFSFHIPL